MIGIYKITSPSKKVYIGQSVDIKKRISYYKNLRCHQQPRLFNSIKKYGWDKHKFEMLALCDADELNKLERYYQDVYCANNPNGLNCMLTNYGDRNGAHSSETRKKMSESKKGITMSAEARLKSSIKQKGRVVSEETKDKMRLAKVGWKPWNVGVPMTAEYKAKMIKNRTGKMTGSSNPSSRIIFDTDTGVYYDSVKEACELNNIPKGTLMDYLRGKHPNKTSLIYA